MLPVLYIELGASLPSHSTLILLCIAVGMQQANIQLQFLSNGSETRSSGNEHARNKRLIGKRGVFYVVRAESR
jgi:hypothetical protein